MSSFVIKKLKEQKSSDITGFTTYVACLGLDFSGKTSLKHIIFHLISSSHPFPSGQIPSSKLCSVDSFLLKGQKVVWIDMPGSSEYRDDWESVLDIADKIVFVIDGSDRIRFPVVHDELSGLFLNPILRQREIPFLFALNSQFIDGDVKSNLHQFEKSMDLKAFRVSERQNLTLCSLSCQNGKGVKDLLHWILEAK